MGSSLQGKFQVVTAAALLQPSRMTTSCAAHQQASCAPRLQSPCQVMAAGALAGTPAWRSHTVQVKYKRHLLSSASLPASSAKTPLATTAEPAAPLGQTLLSCPEHVGWRVACTDSATLAVTLLLEPLED